VKAAEGEGLGVQGEDGVFSSNWMDMIGWITTVTILRG
jgi:hypothetical protein